MLPSPAGSRRIRSGTPHLVRPFLYKGYYSKKNVLLFMFYNLWDGFTERPCKTNINHWVWALIHVCYTFWLFSLLYQLQFFSHAFIFSGFLFPVLHDAIYIYLQGVPLYFACDQCSKSLQRSVFAKLRIYQPLKLIPSRQIYRYIADYSSDIYIHSEIDG